MKSFQYFEKRDIKLKNEMRGVIMGYPLVCSICHKPYSGSDNEYQCAECGGSIEIDYPLDSEVDKLKSIIEKGSSKGIWGYKPLLPVDESIPPVSLDEGNTPLLHAQNLERSLNCGPIYLKNETLNPTGTYKDRFASVAITLEKAGNVSAVALGSAGNAAAALSAYSAKTNIPCFVFLPTGAVQERAMQIMAYGAHLIYMRGTIDDCIHTAHLGESLFAWKNVITSMRFHPYGAEGYKTIAYELGRQLNFQAPDWMVCPMGGGSLFGKIYKGFAEMHSLGLINKLPRFAAIQAEGCAPLVQAYRNNQTTTQKWKNPDTIAFAIADVDTFEGKTALHIIRKTNGIAEAVNDSEILVAMRLIAEKEGVLAEPASATTVAGVKKLLASNVIRKSESIVCIISGSGMRDLKLLTSGMKPVSTIDINDKNAVIAAVSDCGFPAK